MNKIRLTPVKPSKPKPLTRFNINIRVKKTSKFVRRNVEAYIVERNNKYYVRLDIKNPDDFEDVTKLYPLTKNSYNTKGKTEVWRKDKRGYIRILRFADDALVFPVPLAIPFKPNMYCTGNIITDIDGIEKFELKSLIKEEWTI